MPINEIPIAGHLSMRPERVVKLTERQNDEYHNP